MLYALSDICYDMHGDFQKILGDLIAQKGFPQSLEVQRGYQKKYSRRRKNFKEHSLSEQSSTASRAVYGVVERTVSTSECREGGFLQGCG